MKIKIAFIFLIMVAVSPGFADFEQHMTSDATHAKWITPPEFAPHSRYNLSPGNPHTARWHAMPEGETTWVAEDGSAIADSVAVTGDGSRIYVGWYLNNENISAYDAAGTASPLWTHDILENGTYDVDGDVFVDASSDGTLVAGTVTDRTRSGEGNSSILFIYDPDTGAVLHPVTMPAAAGNPENTERITHLDVAATGGMIAVAAVGERSTANDPFHIYLVDADGSPLHTFTIEDPTGLIHYINDMKISGDGSRLVVDIRQTVNPSHLVKVWDLATYAEIDSWEIANSPPQCSLGVSADGSIVAVGDLHGKLRVFQFDTGSQSYGELWRFSIPIGTYYPWVTSIAVSDSGTTIAMGSYEPDNTEGYLYVFDTNLGNTPIYKSPNFGDDVSAVAISPDGSIISAASWGPQENPASGWDLIVYSRVSDSILYGLNGSEPGSLFACALNSAGTRVAAGGKAVHAREMGSGGRAYSLSISQDFPTQTPTPSPSPTPTCPETGASGTLNQEFFHPGDPFELAIAICNGNRDMAIDNPVFLILDVYGIYYFAPAWTMDLDFYRETVQPCGCIDFTALSFTWPDTNTSGTGIRFYAAMTNTDMTEIVGNLSTLEFGWSFP